MAKVKCLKCGRGNAKRSCAIKNGRKICPACCAKIRTPRCEGCTYYESFPRYDSKKPQKERHFVFPLDPALEDECGKALALAERGEIGCAENIMKGLLKECPDYHMVQYGMGVCLALQNRFEEALPFFRKAAEIFPYFIEAYFNLAMASTKMGDIPGAIKAFKEVVLIGSHQDLVGKAKAMLNDFETTITKHHGVSMETFLSSSEIFTKAFAALQRKEYRLAVDLFNRLLSAHSNHVQSWGNVGLAYAGLGMKMKALECFDKAIEIDPDYELALVNRVLVERMVEGEALDQDLESVDYYKEYWHKKKSYLTETVGKLASFIKKD